MHEALIYTMEKVHSSGCDEYAGGHLKQLWALFGMKLSVILIAPTKQLSRTLQGKIMHRKRQEMLLLSLRHTSISKEQTLLSNSSTEMSLLH